LSETQKTLKISKPTGTLHKLSAKHSIILCYGYFDGASLSLHMCAQRHVSRVGQNDLKTLFFPRYIVTEKLTAVLKT